MSEPTRYTRQNERYDLMTDSEVRTITADDLQAILVRLASLFEDDNTIGRDLYHRLYELQQRYPDDEFSMTPLSVIK